ncbi:hypothetical protein FAGKG844_250041 [Frankia sp. AgKG'84/4]
MTAEQDAGPGRRRAGPSRRLLVGGGVAAGGALTAIGADQMLGWDEHAPAASPDQASPHGSRTEPFHGVHQTGIATVPQAHATFLALDQRDGVDRDGLRRMLRILTDDTDRLTRGEPALADSKPELGLVPARPTVTFGFGPDLVARAAGDAAVPSWLRALPPFSIDRLDPAWTGGDLLLHLGAADPVTAAHAARMLVKDCRGFAAVRWRQTGFRRSHGAEPAGTTMRNPFGRIDGSANPTPGTVEFDRLVWCGADHDWLAGGSSLVLRRIAMNLDKWDRLDRSDREQAVGRSLSNGAADGLPGA